FSGSRSHNGSNLHSLGGIARMVDLFHIACSQTNLVAVGAVTVSRLRDDLSLRQLTLHCFFQRPGRIRRTSHTHCLVYISTTGQRISDSSAQTGSCSSERLDLRG